jgi:uncharacterized membrane protein
MTVADADAPSVLRLVTFSDAVFAIAITLLALQLRVPTIKDPKSASQLARALGDQGTEFFTYLITFALIGVYWLAHHTVFEHIRGHNRRLSELNLLFLLTVSFLPFPADLIGHYPDNQVAVMVYGGTLAAVSLTSGTLWMYAYRTGLTTADVTPRLAHYYLLRAGVPAAVFLASIPVALASAHAAARLWLLAFVGLLVLRRLYPAERGN